MNRRLRAAAYGNQVALAAWLESQGHPIKKSQLGVYALRLRAIDAAGDGALIKLTPAERLYAAELRIKCLQAAIDTGGKANILDRASEFVDWAFNPAAKVPGGQKAPA